MGPRHSVINEFMRLAYSSLNASNTPVKPGNIVFILVPKRSAV